MTSYLALGDSYTIGEGVEPARRWPVVLADRKGWSPPRIIATTGWTVAELEQAIDSSTDSQDRYDRVSLLIGVNDEYRGGSVEDYEVSFARILQTSLRFAANEAERVFVVSIPDYGVTPFAGERGAEIGARIDEYNAVAKRISQQRGVEFVDITPTSRQMPDALVSDGLHPDAEQYATWVDQIALAVD